MKRVAIAAAGTALLVASLITVTQLGELPRGAAPAAETTPARHQAVDPEALPAPKGKTVLRVTGAVRGNSGPRTTKVDFATLDRLARERVTVHEPFVRRDVAFTGIRVRTLLQSAGVDATARRLYMHALDDYHVDLSVADLADDAILATRENGRRIPLAAGGPIRLVFTSESKLARNTDNWIWSIDSIRASR
jgi:hypothetical protein